MADSSAYVPPKVWTWDAESGGRFAKINRPIAGATHEKVLPVGRHPLQLHSLATPNGVKVTILLEELLAIGKKGAEYDAYLDQHRRRRSVRKRLRRDQSQLEDPGAARPEHDAADPRVRIRRDPRLPGREVRRLPAEGAERAGGVPVVGLLADGVHALSGRRLRPLLRLRSGEARVPDQSLCDGGEAPARRARPRPGRAARSSRATRTRSPTWRSSRGTAGSCRASSTSRAEFLDVKSYKNVLRWTEEIQARPAVKRGQRVNRAWGPEAERVPERHDASDFK